jgi:predicted DCC family thiol-disulfide oxidoreductase YuxK
MVILFDGVCNLCNGVVRFIIKRDKKNVFKFASLQSAYGEEFLKNHILPQILQRTRIKSVRSAKSAGEKYLETIVLVDGENIYTQSDAVIAILKSLGGVWKLAAVFKIIPKPVRNGVYRFIAKYRYNVFGKRGTCMVPTEEMKGKFIEN